MVRAGRAPPLVVLGLVLVARDLRGSDDGRGGRVDGLARAERQEALDGERRDLLGLLLHLLESRLKIS